MTEQQFLESVAKSFKRLSKQLPEAVYALSHSVDNVAEALGYDPEDPEHYDPEENEESEVVPLKAVASK